MKKIFAIDSCRFYLYDVNASIIFNNEKYKKSIIDKINLQDFYIIDTKILEQNITVSDFLKINMFNMKLIPFFDIQNLMSKKFNLLPFEKKLFLKIIVLLGLVNKKICFNDVLTYLKEEDKQKVFKYIKENNIFFINFTSDVEEIIYTKYLIVLSNDKVAIEGSISSVLKEERLLKKLGFNLPFVYDLSLQLISYGLIDKQYLSVEKLVNDIWN